MSKIAKSGDTIKLHYKGTLSDGKVFDSTEGKDPFEFDLGAGQVIEGFELAITGMAEGEKKTVVIPADQAYGESNPEYVVEAQNDQLPQDMKMEIGMQLMMPVPGGESISVTVIEVNDDGVTLDANPPLAGEELTFELEVVGILTMND